MPRLCTASHIRDPRKEENNCYLADPEVDVEFASGVDKGLQQPGIVFYFKAQRNRMTSTPRQPENLVGHFDFESAPAVGWPRETGNARACFHNLILSHKLPLGTPLVVGQRLEMLRGAETIGICCITAVIDLAQRKVQLCRPVANSFIELKLSRRETSS